jgi:hypothetical protein
LPAEQNTKESQKHSHAAQNKTWKLIFQGIQGIQDHSENQGKEKV